MKKDDGIEEYERALRDEPDGRLRDEPMFRVLVAGSLGATLLLVALFLTLRGCAGMLGGGGKPKPARQAGEADAYLEPPTYFHGASGGHHRASGQAK